MDTFKELKLTTYSPSQNQYSRNGVRSSSKTLYHSFNKKGNDILKVKRDGNEMIWLLDEVIVVKQEISLIRSEDWYFMICLSPLDDECDFKIKIL